MCTMKNSFASGLVCMLVVMTPFVTHAVPLKLPLEEMVTAADTIVVARTISVDPIIDESDKKPFTKYRALLHVEKRIKGKVGLEIEVFYSDEWSFEAALRPNITYLLFLQKRGSEFHVVQGYGGLVVIDRQVARGIFMDEELGTQDADNFIKRIRSYSSK